MNSASGEARKQGQFEKRSGSAGERGASRIVRHDWLVLFHSFQAALPRWRDRLTLALGLPFLVVVARSWLVTQTADIALVVLAASTFIGGFASTRAICARLAFHRTDGVLATDALRPSLASRYAAILLVAGLLIAAIVLKLLDTRALSVGISAMMAGIVAGLLTIRALGSSRFRYVGRLSRTISYGLRQNRFAILCGVIGAVVTYFASFLSGAAATALLGTAVAFFALLLTSIDSERVRFTALCGFGPWRSVWSDLCGPLIFAGCVMPAAFVFAGTIGLAIAGGIVLFAGLLATMRVLAYRVHTKRSADLINSILLAMLALIGFSFPPALLFVVPMVLWWLWRGAARTTWMVA